MPLHGTGVVEASEQDSLEIHTHVDVCWAQVSVDKAQIMQSLDCSCQLLQDAHSMLLHETLVSNDLVKSVLFSAVGKSNAVVSLEDLIASGQVLALVPSAKLKR